MHKRRYLNDGTQVEVIKRKKNEANLNEVKIRPAGKEHFDSGVNPWILECYLLSEPPAQIDEL